MWRYERAVRRTHIAVLAFMVPKSVGAMMLALPRQLKGGFNSKSEIRLFDFL